MTTPYAPTGQVAPAAEYTLPQDVIDFVIVETVNNPFVTAADNAAWLLLLSKNVINIDNFGAVGDGTADDSAAIQSAIDALVTLGGGALLIPPRNFRVTIAPSFGCDMQIVGVSGRSRVTLDSATSDVFQISNGSGSAKTTVSGLTLRCTQITTGIGINVADDGDKSILFRDCVLDFSLVSGEAISNVGSSTVTLENCETTSGKTSSGQSLLSGTGSFIVRGGSLTMAPGATDDLVATSGGGFVSLEAVTLRRLSSSTSDVAFVTAFATENVVIEGCIVDTDQATGSTSLVRVNNGAKITASGNDLTGKSGAQCPPFLIAGFAAQGSRIQGRPIRASDEGTSTAITLVDGYEEIVVSCAATASPDITFPNAAYPGQPLRFTYFDASASAVQPTIANSPPVTGTVVPTINAGNTLTGEFRWQSYDPLTLPYRWVQIGTWGVGTPL